MAIPAQPLAGDQLLDAVTVELVALHKRHYGREPASARSMMMEGEVLACVMGGVYTLVEKTLIELGQQTVVQQTRSTFQTTMQPRFIDIVQSLSGRRVVAFISNQHVGPDMEIELFVLAPARALDDQ